MTIRHGMDGALGGNRYAGEPAEQPLAEFASQRTLKGTESTQAGSLEIGRGVGGNFMPWFSNLFKKTPYDEIASEFGFAVRKVERDLPYFKGSRAPKAEIRRGECIQYELRKPAKYGDWSLLQRGPQDGAQLDGFLLTAQENKNLPFLLEQLTPVAKQFSDDFFEFERKGDFLHVFWDQWGGRKTVAEIYQALDQLTV